MKKNTKTFVSKEENLKIKMYLLQGITHIEYLSKFSSKASNNSTNFNKCVWNTNIFPTKFKSWWNRFSGQLTDDGVHELELPSPHNLMCQKQFKHKWHNLTENNNIKMYFVENCFYWLCNENNVASIEVWITDDTVLKSHPTNKFYFQLHKLTDKFPILTYSVNSLPQESRLKNIVKNSSNLLVNFSSDSKNFFNYCILDKPNNEVKRRLIQYQIVFIPNLGRFSYAQNKVQIIFCDGITIYVEISDEQFDILCINPSLAFQSLELRLYYPSGKYLQIPNLYNFAPMLSCYLEPCKEWILWILNSKEERIKNPFCAKTIYCEKLQGRIDEELQKIAKSRLLQENDSSTLPSVEEVVRNNQKMCKELQIIIDKRSNRK